GIGAFRVTGVQTCALPISSSLREYNWKAPNMLLYWSFREELSRRGVGVFNCGRCTPGGGTHRFKLQWGGRDEPLCWGQWSARGEIGRASRRERAAESCCVV